MLKILTATTLATLTLTQNSPQQIHIQERNIPAACTQQIDQAIKSLTQQHGEQLLWMGKTTGKERYILTLNPHTQTWTWLLLTDKELCIMAMGQGIYIPQQQKTQTL
jgi:hypothetical protein